MATTKPEAAIVAAKIKQAREQKGWTIYELAKRAEMGETHIKKIENGDYCIRTDILNKLCKTLGVDVLFPLDR